ncbi:hypothetical protein HPP92_001936 [Vanilla planifolia]|uniref:Uncharacterized protein n=1 Tax=Vanilla planifolia TaxID=51239 RepID=A0A835VIG5_VANPL|nr:hypothetical protein HPP92_001936 [Vanilla planifolia]
MIHAQLQAVLSKNELLLEQLPDSICNLFCFTLLHGYGWVVKEDYTKVIINFLMERASNTGNDGCMIEPEEHALKFGRFLKRSKVWQTGINPPNSAPSRTIRGFFIRPSDHWPTDVSFEEILETLRADS